MAITGPVTCRMVFSVAVAASTCSVAHDALDVLEHHDRVVDHDADREHHAEEGQRIDGEAERVHAGERADERNRHREAWNECRTPVAKEKVDDREDEHEGDAERLDHFLDRDPHEIRRVEGDFVLEALRKVRGDLLHARAHTIHRLERIRAGLQEDADWHRGFAVEECPQAVALGAELDARDILDAHDGTVRIAADDDVAELPGREEPAARRHRVGELDWLVERWRADAARRQLGILCTQGVSDVGRGKAERVQFLGIEPDAHCIGLRVEEPRAADARHALQFLDDVARGEVRDVDAVIAGAVARERDEAENASLRLGGQDAEPAHLFRQLRQRRLYAVIDLDERLVGIGTDLECHVDRDVAARTRGRGHVDHADRAVDLLFEGRGHGFGDDFRARARIARVHLNRRRQDVRGTVPRAAATWRRVPSAR